jgi:hypothetical protein
VTYGVPGDARVIEQARLVGTYVEREVHTPTLRRGIDVWQLPATPKASMRIPVDDHRRESRSPLRVTSRSVL